METSLRVFCGPHIPEQAAIEINEKYWAITQALELVNFPLAIPGTNVYKAIQARKVAHTWLELAAHNRLDAQLAQIGLVHRSVQAVKTEVRVWIQASDWLDQTYREPRGRVHGNVESDDVGGTHGVFL